MQNLNAWNPTLLGCYQRNSQAGWDYNTAEWACASWEEGMATFLADSTLYNAHAGSPHSCFAQAASCATGTWNIENSTPVPCAYPVYRWPLVQMQTLWDIFDSVQDGETMQEGSTNWWRMYGVYSGYSTGTGLMQTDEHWDSALTSVDYADGRGMESYQFNYLDFTASIFDR